ncbi:MAG: DMT family transporter [Lachnospiraceae bacterium]|jgi:drug/metabolite transporter (DMT)-like permease|nr:DMT family transporter [Lachnospiraceae bacterium]
MNKTVSDGKAKIALFGASLIWGSSFLVVKNSVDTIAPHVLLLIRFSIGALLLCLIFFRRLKELNRDYFIKGSLLGLLLFLGYSLQTIGITDTTPGKNAFLSAIYCVLVPFIFWAVDRKKPDSYNFLAALVGITGIGFVSLNGDLTIRMGDAFTLAGGVFYAAHMVALAKLSRDKDPVLLTIMQFAYGSVFSLIVALLFEEAPKQLTTDTILGLGFLAVFATAGAILLQNIGQKYTSPTSASIILSLESVFGVLFSVLFYHEEITLRIFIGFLLIFLAVIISETKLSFLRRKQKAVSSSNKAIVSNEAVASEE